MTSNCEVCDLINISDIAGLIKGSIPLRQFRCHICGEYFTGNGEAIAIVFARSNPAMKKRFKIIKSDLLIHYQELQELCSRCNTVTEAIEMLDRESPKDPGFTEEQTKRIEIFTYIVKKSTLFTDSRVYRTKSGAVVYSKNGNKAVFDARLNTVMCSLLDGVTREFMQTREIELSILKAIEFYIRKGLK